MLFSNQWFTKCVNEHIYRLFDKEKKLVFESKVHCGFLYGFQNKQGKISLLFCPRRNEEQEIECIYIFSCFMKLLLLLLLFCIHRGR